MPECDIVPYFACMCNILLVYKAWAINCYDLRRLLECKTPMPCVPTEDGGVPRAAGQHAVQADRAGAGQGQVARGWRRDAGGPPGRD